MARKRKIDSVSSGRAACDTAIVRVRPLAGPACEIAVLESSPGVCREWDHECE